VPLAKVASLVMVGKTLEEIKFTKEVIPTHISVKESVLPFSRFAGVDTVLGPEMKSTGEVMGVDTSFGMAFAKSQAGAGVTLPTEGLVFISVQSKEKERIVELAQKLAGLGFTICSTQGTGEVLEKNGIQVEYVNKVGEGRPDIIDKIKNNQIAMIINSPSGKKPKDDMKQMRNLAVNYQIPCITTLQGARAAVSGIEALLKDDFTVKSLQEYHM